MYLWLFFMNKKHRFASCALAFQNLPVLYRGKHLRSVWDKPSDAKALFGLTHASKTNAYHTSQHTVNGKYPFLDSERHHFILLGYDWLVQIVTEHETDVYVMCWPPPQRKQRARSFPVPRGSMATGGCLAKLDLSASTKKKKQRNKQKRLKWMRKTMSGFVIQWNTLVFSPYLLLKVILLGYCMFLQFL